MSKNLFNSIKLMRQKRNVFDLTHDVKMSLDMGELVPILVQECVPGDRFTISCESILRFAPLVAPVMHRFNVFTHYFFVPNRIVWDGWEDWITQKPGAPAFPTIEIGEDQLNTPLVDYMGIPTPISGSGQSEVVNAIPFSAYQMVCNEYYRDQNLIPEIPFKLSNGDNSSNIELAVLRIRAWQHDYFTSALPFAQKGAAVDIPLGAIEDDVPVFRKTVGNLGDLQSVSITAGSGTGQVAQFENAATTSPDIANLELFAGTEGLEVGATTINDLRRAFKLQEWLERNAVGGTRYTENIFAHFGVKSPDARLQRPEYITGTKSPVIISEVLNTTGSFSDDDPTSPPQGNMAGHGIAVTSGKYGGYFVQEHGFVIGIMSVMPITAYQQGIPKHFLKTEDPFQYFWPSFAHIGEQEIYNRELYAYTATGGDVFGYTPRYAEYKYAPSRVAGDFRTTLDYWHMGRIFNTQPALNKAFIECTPGKRIFAVTSDEEDSLYVHVLNKIKAVRPMPKFGTPHM